MNPKRAELRYDATSALTEVRRFSNVGGTQPVVNTRFTYECTGCSELLAVRHRLASNDAVIHDLALTRDAASTITRIDDAEALPLPLEAPSAPPLSPPLSPPPSLPPSLPPPLPPPPKNVH